MGVRYVEGLQRKYKGNWVDVRMVAVGGYSLSFFGRELGVVGDYSFSVLVGVVVGVTERGYGKIRYAGYESLGEEPVLRIKERGEWKEYTEYELGERGYRVYANVSTGYLLGLEPFIGGCEIGIEDELYIMRALDTFGVVGLCIEVKVKSIEGLWGLVEQGLFGWVNAYENRIVSKIYLDEGVDLSGVTIEDLVCIGGILYMSEEQTEQIDWLQYEIQEKDDMVGELYENGNCTMFIGEASEDYGVRIQPYKCMWCYAVCGDRKNIIGRIYKGEWMRLRC